MTEISKLLEREILPVDTTEAISSQQIELVDEAKNVFKDLLEWIAQTSQNDELDTSTTIH